MQHFTQGVEQIQDRQRGGSCLVRPGLQQLPQLVAALRGDMLPSVRQQLRLQLRLQARQQLRLPKHHAHLQLAFGCMLQDELLQENRIGVLAGVLDWVAQLQLFQPKQQLVVAVLHECTIAAVILELTECIGGRCNEI